MSSMSMPSLWQVETIGGAWALLLVEERLAAAEVETTSQVSCVLDGAHTVGLSSRLTGSLVLRGVGVDLVLDVANANALLERTERSVIALDHTMTVGEAVVDLDHQSATTRHPRCEAVDDHGLPDGL